MSKCLPQNKGKYFFNKFAIISEDDTVASNAKTFFENFVFKQQYFDDPKNLYNKDRKKEELDWSCDTFKTDDEVFDIIRTEQ